MKKTLVGVLSLLMLAGLFAGCAATPTSAPTQAPVATAAPTQAPATPAPTPAKENVTISFICSQDWIFDPEQALSKTFTDQTGITVDYQIVPSDQYPNLLQTKLNSGECPDIFMSQDGKFDIVSTLNIEKNGVDLSGEEWASRMDKLTAAEASVNGKLYGQVIFDNSSVWAVCYNKTIFQSLGIQVPKNYADFKAACAKIAASGVTPIYEPVSDGWHHVLWFPELGPGYEKAEPGLSDKLNNNTEKFADSAIMTTSLTELKEIATLGYFGKNYLSDAVADQPAKMASGKYAMTVSNSSLPDQIVAADATQKLDNFGFFVMPLADNQSINMNFEGPTRFIYSGSKYIAEAKKYFSFIAQPDNLQNLIDKTPRFLNLPFSGLKDKYTQAVKDFFASYTDKGPVFQASIKYVNPQWMDMGKDITAMFTGQETPVQVLQAIDQRRASQAAAAKDPAWAAK
jgi:raffinose/stachyose/melibiose transport system substrate-binding protein